MKDYFDFETWVGEVSELLQDHRSELCANMEKTKELHSMVVSEDWPGDFRMARSRAYDDLTEAANCIERYNAYEIELSRFDKRFENHIQTENT